MFLPKPPSGSERRAFGRRRQEGLDCNLGPILDLSRGGMRVQCTSPPEGELEVVISTMDGDEVSLQAEVRWTAKKSSKKYQAGLRFLDVDDAKARVLTKISTLHQFVHDG